MNYAPNTYTRNDNRSIPTQTNRFTFGNRLFCRPFAIPQRPQRNPQGQKAVRPAEPLADGFLKSRFLPKLAVNHDLAKLTDKQQEQRERDFYRSLSQLAGHYSFTPMETRCYPYPYNLTLALWDAEEQIRQSPKGKNYDNLLLYENNETKHLFLSVTERYNTGMNFYFVPVIPLFKMLKDRKRRYTAHLLQSVFCYLKRIVGMPYYRNNNTFLYWQYEMIEDWTSQDDESEDNKQLIWELQKAKLLGDRMNWKITAENNLSHWKERMQSYQANDPFDSEIFLLTAKFFQLYQQYPNRTVFRHVNTLWDEGYSFYNDDEIRITMDKYIGFIADDKGWLNDHLCETVNQEFSQYSEIEEPTVTHHFDGTPTEKDLLAFENRFFPLIGELNYLLNLYNSNKTNKL